MEEALVNDFQIMERSLVKEWGLDARLVADTRKAYLRVNVHWQWRDTRVWLSPGGVEELKKYLVPKSEAEKVGEKEGREQEQIARRLPNTYPLSVDVVAIDRIWANPRLIRCLDGNGEYVTVRVRSNRLFRRGMRINLATQCVYYGAASAAGGRARGTYEFIDRHPRLPGRW